MLGNREAALEYGVSPQGYNRRMSKRNSPIRKPAVPRASRVGGRDNQSGQFIPVNDARRRPTTTTRERIPLPGQSRNIDSGMQKKDQGSHYDYSTSPSGRFIESDRQVLTSAKGEKVAIYRDSRTGSFTSRRSTEEIQKVSTQAAESLKRLAKR